jgi:hypothetical protein
MVSQSNFALYWELDMPDFDAFSHGSAVPGWQAELAGLLDKCHESDVQRMKARDVCCCMCALLVLQQLLSGFSH